MKKLLIYLILPIALFSGCKTKQPADDRPVLTVTILPYQYFAEQLIGDHFRINVLVPPGASHHNYDPTPRQLKDLENSAVLFMNGHLGFEEAWAPRMKSNYPKMAIVNLSTGIDLITVEGGEGGHEEGEHEAGDHNHDHEGVDPHYWLSVKEAKTIARNMAHGLMKAEPACKQMIEQNLVQLTLRLDSLALEMSAAFEGMTKKSFMIFHPALAYFARDYGMTQHSMELAGKEPTASHFRELVDLARKDKINTIFIQKEYDQENATTFARETGATIVVIDPMSPDWLGEMRELAVKIVAMEGR
jgi:zinc transport system substrate-binding protein